MESATSCHECGSSLIPEPRGGWDRVRWRRNLVVAFSLSLFVSCIFTFIHFLKWLDYARTHPGFGGYSTGNCLLFAAVGGVLDGALVFVVAFVIGLFIFRKRET